MSMAGPKAARSSMKKVRCIPSMAEASGDASAGLQGGPLWAPNVTNDSFPEACEE